MNFWIASKLVIQFLASERVGSIYLLAVYWLGNCYLYCAQGWVTTKIIQICITL